MTSPRVGPKCAFSRSAVGIPRAAGLASAILRSCFLTLSHASITALPMNTVERLADVDESNGTTDVSPITMAMRSGARPSSCAAICIMHGARALAHVGRAADDGRAAVEVQAHDRDRARRGRRALQPERDATPAIRRQAERSSRSRRRLSRARCAHSPSAGVSSRNERFSLCRAGCVVESRPDRCRARRPLRSAAIRRPMTPAACRIRETPCSASCARAALARRCARAASRYGPHAE